MSNDFKKIVRIGLQSPEWAPRAFSTFCVIKYKGGKLSITGVQGPLRNGNALGSCGQMYDSLIESGAGFKEFADGWNQSKLEKFVKIWQAWHLNDMRPYCSHQKHLRETARQEVTLYNHSQTMPVYKSIKATMKRAESAIKTGESFTPTKEESALACLPLSLITYNDPESPEFFERTKDTSYSRGKETKTRGWIGHKESPEFGLLGLPCTKCESTYGGAWHTEKVPARVISFLQALPESDKTPAWC
jgi:hypothetical protein